MKVKLLQRTNIEDVLTKTRSEEFTQKDHQKHLKNLFKSIEISTLNSFDFDKLSTNKIYHIVPVNSHTIDHPQQFPTLKTVLIKNVFF